MNLVVLLDNHASHKTPVPYVSPCISEDVYMQQQVSDDQRRTSIVSPLLTLFKTASCHYLLVSHVTWIRNFGELFSLYLLSL